MQPTADQPTATLTDADIDIRPGMVLPLPDDAAGAAARDRLSAVDIGVSAPTIAALGMMAEAVVFVAAVQGTAFPRPLLSTRVVLLTGSHAGGVVAGPAPDPRNAAPLQHLAINAGAGIVTLEWQPAAAAIELEDAITIEQMDASLRAGWAEAERAADEGIELLVLAGGGAGAAVASAAVVAAITGAEPTMLLSRVVTPAGLYDDNAWMTRCLALRDALHRVRQRDGDPRTVLSALGGADLAAATGLILGAAARRTPIMIDGPVGAAAALLANDFSPQSRSWVVLPDTGRHPAVRLAADSLQLRPWLDLCLDLGEGATSLAALPMLQTALTLAGAGEEVEPQPLTRFDSTGNQIFVGVAKALEPEEADEEAFTGSTLETASVLYASGHASGDAMAATPSIPAPAAPADEEPAKDEAKDEAKATTEATPEAKPEPAKTEAAKPETPPRSTAPRPGAKPITPAKGGVKQPTRTATKPPAKAAGKQALTAKTSPSKTVPARKEAAKDVTAARPTVKDPAKETAKQPATEAAKEPATDAPKEPASTKDTAPKDTAPQDTAPKDTAPKDTTPKDTAPRDAAAKDEAKVPAEAQPSASNGAGPATPPAPDTEAIKEATKDATTDPAETNDADTTAAPEVIAAGSGAPSPPRPRKRP